MNTIGTNIKGLMLRNYRNKDIESYAKYASNYNIWRYMRDEFPFPCTDEMAKEYIESTCLTNEKMFFAISYNEQFIGDIHISKQTDILNMSGCLGYWLAEEYWGKGYMTEAVISITEYTFATSLLNRIFARVMSHNVGSIRVLEKARYIKEGHFRKAVVKEDNTYDQLQYAILKEYIF